MTDNDIIKAFKCCNTENGCKWCVLNKNGGLCDPKVHSDFMDSVLDLINRQKAEIERLEELNGLYPFKVKVGHNSEVHSKSIQDYDSFLDGVSTEAIKEFAERLKERKYQSSDWSHGEHPYVVEVSDIDDLVEEMERKEI